MGWSEPPRSDCPADTTSRFSSGRGRTRSPPRLQSKLAEQESPFREFGVQPLWFGDFAQIPRLLGRLG